MFDRKKTLATVVPVISSWFAGAVAGVAPTMKRKLAALEE